MMFEHIIASKPIKQIFHSLYKVVATKTFFFFYFLALFFLSFFFPLSQLSLMLQATACPRRLTVWEVGVASFSRRMCGSETALDSQGTRGPGQIQGKSD